MTAGALVALAVPASAHIANPGSFTLTVTNGNVGLGLLQVPLPTGPLTGQIDSDGNISIPPNSLQVTGEPFSYDNTLSGFDVAVSGTATIGSGSITGTLDPGSGAASLSTSMFASVTFTGAVDGVQVYSGTCSVGGSAAADQVPVTLTTNPPSGVPYSEQDGTVTVAGGTSTSVTCDPDLPDLLQLLFPLVAGQSAQITVSGTTTPILLQDSHLSLSPNPVNFGEVQLGTSKSATVTFSNSGTDATDITGLSVGGADASDFSVVTSSLTCQQDTSGIVVPAQGSCSVDFTFTPGATGDRSATIAVPNSSSDGARTLTLTGTGINPVLSANPASLSFGDQVDGTTSPAMAVTVANAGTTDLVVTSASASGDFSSDASACTSQPIAPNQTCVISVSFSPTATGGRSGTLTIKSNALSSPDSVSLSGTGIAPLISVTPGTLQFGSVPVTSTSAPQSVTVANAGTSDLTVTSAAASGPFAVSSDACTGAGAIAPGGTCQIAVVFTPSSTGPASGTLKVSSDGGTATVALSGSGSPVADLNVSIGASPNPVKRKSNLTYAVTVQNAGPSAATGTEATDTLPSNVQFESLAAPSGSSCTAPAVGSTGTVKCNIGSMPTGATAQLTIVVLVVAPKAATITDTVKVTSSTTDPDLTDNQATVSTFVK
jgi:uncharacterized repeat protein (TIGR01451 family)